MQLGGMLVAELGAEVIRGWSKGTLLPRGTRTDLHPGSGGCAVTPVRSGKAGVAGLGVHASRRSKLGAKRPEDEAKATRPGPSTHNPPEPRLRAAPRARRPRSRQGAPPPPCSTLSRSRRSST